MANLNRVRVELTGAAVTGGGVSTFYFLSGATGFTADLGDFWEVVASFMPDSCTVIVPNSGETIDLATGQPNGTWTDGTPESHTGSGGSNFFAGVGARAVWETLGYVNGRRVRGSTFLVPLRNGVADNGTIETSVLEDLQDAADALVAAQSGDFVVWTRAVGGSGGVATAVTNAVIPDVTSWLRSRRT